MSSPNSSTSWRRLPQETRDTILKFLLHDGCPLAPLATVSKEWQMVVERHNFARITLTPSRLADFGSVIHRNRSLVRYLWLCLELDEYDCTTCDPREPGEGGLNNGENTLITTAIQNLFSTLSTWEKTSGSLLLDISVYSPSDSEHHFKYLTFEPDTDGFSDERWGRVQHGMTGDDVRHGWTSSSRVSAPNFWAIDRIFEDIMGEGPFDTDEEEDQWWDQLPLVPAVTGVLLRQQNRRRWKPTALRRMLAHFPRLQEFHYEPWREWETIFQGCADAAYRSLVESLASSGLRRLVLFENSNQDYMPTMMKRGQVVGTLGSTCNPIRIPNSNVGAAVANTSLNLEHLSASFIVDADHFFEACQPSWRWPSLTSLALTSQLLAPDESPAEINSMLRRAAEVAIKMPNLGRMEIWNGREGLAMLFQYRTTMDGRAVITRRGTWEFNLESSVIQAWKAAALRHGRRRCAVVEELLVDPTIIGYHGDAIHHLKLSTQVIRPVSLKQIRMNTTSPEGVRHFTSDQLGRTYLIEHSPWG